MKIEQEIKKDFLVRIKISLMFANEQRGGILRSQGKFYLHLLYILSFSDRMNGRKSSMVFFHIIIAMHLT